MTNLKEKTIGWTAYEEIGIGVPNPELLEQKFICPVCNAEIHNMLIHARSMSDQDHIILEIMLS